MKTNSCFPFSAIVGQEKIKKALLLNVINPRIGGVLISGEKGTAKSTLVRGLADLTEDMRVIDLPLNITEDKLVGSLDLQKAIKQGERAFEAGLLQKAHRNFLYVDEVNLLSEHIVNILLEVSSLGVNIVEREGLSYSHPSRFVLVGSMNPEEGLLRPQFIDRFGLYVEANGEKDIDFRKEIIARRLEYEKDAAAFCLKWKRESKEIKTAIKRGKENLKKVFITGENYEFAAKLAAEGNCAGHRAEIVLLETAKALAAYEGKDNITENNVLEAAALALPHRIKEALVLEEFEEDSGDVDMETEEDKINRGDEREGKKEKPPNNEKESGNEEGKGEETAEETENINPVRESLKIEVTFGSKAKDKGSGKRSRVKTDSRQGRCVKYRLPKGKTGDIALAATFRMAACRQKNRKGGRLALNVRAEDIREKVREKRTGVTILFAVDASGSMGAKRRMGAVKGAVLSLLHDAYQKRDSVGIIAFREDKAEVLLNITRSVELAQKCLKSLPTGGKTPLALGLQRAFEILKTERIKNPEVLQYLILVSDGKANMAIKSDDPFEDSLFMAERIHNEGIKSMVLDTEKTYIQFGFARELAKRMDSKYIKLGNLSQTEIKNNVQQLIKMG